MLTHCVPSDQGALLTARTWQGGPSDDSTRRWGSIWPVLAVELLALGMVREALAMATRVRTTCREEGVGQVLSIPRGVSDVNEA